MKLSKFVATALALSMGLTSVAFAQGRSNGDGSRAEQRDGRHDRGSERAPDRSGDRGRPGMRDDHRRDDARQAHRHSRNDSRYERAWSRQDPRWNQRWARGAGPTHNLYRGGRLPPQYRSHVYVVNDWRGQRLHRPPAGYHWVQTGGDFVLVAITTGVILSILLNH